MDILTAIEQLGPQATPAEIAGVTGKSRGAVKTALHRLKQQGVVTSEGGVYRLLRPVTRSKVTSGPTTPREDDMDWLLGDAVTDNPPPPWLPESTRGEDEGRSVTGYSNRNRVTAHAAYGPVATWAQGFEDGYGAPPDPDLARQQVRFLLANMGIAPETRAVQEKVSAGLYLERRRAGSRQAEMEAQEAERRRRQEQAGPQTEEELRRREVLENVARLLATLGKAEARRYLSLSSGTWTPRTTRPGWRPRQNCWCRRVSRLPLGTLTADCTAWRPKFCCGLCVKPCCSLNRPNSCIVWNNGAFGMGTPRNSPRGVWNEDRFLRGDDRRRGANWRPRPGGWTGAGSREAALQGAFPGGCVAKLIPLRKPSCRGGAVKMTALVICGNPIDPFFSFFLPRAILI